MASCPNVCDFYVMTFVFQDNERKTIEGKCRETKEPTLQRSQFNKTPFSLQLVLFFSGFTPFLTCNAGILHSPNGFVWPRCLSF